MSNKKITHVYVVASGDGRYSVGSDERLTPQQAFELALPRFEVMGDSLGALVEVMEVSDDNEYDDPITYIDTVQALENAGRIVERKKEIKDMTDSELDLAIAGEWPKEWQTVLHVIRFSSGKHQIIRAVSTRDAEQGPVESASPCEDLNVMRELWAALPFEDKAFYHMKLSDIIQADDFTASGTHIANATARKRAEAMLATIREHKNPTIKKTNL